MNNTILVKTELANELMLNLDLFAGLFNDELTTSQLIDLHKTKELINKTLQEYLNESEKSF